MKHLNVSLLIAAVILSIAGLVLQITQDHKMGAVVWNLVACILWVLLIRKGIE